MQSKEGNKGRVGTEDIGFDYYYRGITAGEYSRLMMNAGYDDGNPIKIDYIDLASMVVTKIENFPAPFESVKTIQDLLNLEIPVDSDDSAFFAQAVWIIGFQIWTEIQKLDKKKSSPEDGQGSKDIQQPARKRLSQLFRGSHRKS